MKRDYPPQTISISYFKKVIIINIYSLILLILILILKFIVYSRRKIIFNENACDKVINDTSSMCFDKVIKENYIKEQMIWTRIN